MSYFSKSEMSCNCGGRFCKGEVVWTDEFLSRMNDVRGECGFPFKVTSGVRCTDYNNEIGSFPQSYHCQGLAGDIVCMNGAKRAKMVSVGLKHGLSVGVYQNFVHFDLRPTDQVVFRGKY